MNKTLAITAIALIAVIMITGSLSPAMATKDDNNGKAEGCEKANENGKANVKNPHCETFFDLCELFTGKNNKFISDWIFDNRIPSEPPARKMTLVEWKAVGGSVKLFNDIKSINMDDGLVAPPEIRTWVTDNC